MDFLEVMYILFIFLVVVAVCLVSVLLMGPFSILVAVPVILLACYHLMDPM